MNERQRDILRDEALYIATVVLSEVPLPEDQAEVVRQAVYTALYAMEAAEPGARMFVAYYRERMPLGWAARVLESFRRLVQFFVELLGGRCTWG